MRWPSGLFPPPSRGVHLGSRVDLGDELERQVACRAAGGGAGGGLEGAERRCRVLATRGLCASDLYQLSLQPPLNVSVTRLRFAG